MIVTKTMALTRKMFFETLPRALDSDAFSVSGDQVTLTNEGRTLTVTFAEQPTFKLGGFAVPRAEIILHFKGYTDDQAETSLKRFERYFHRGGG